MSNRPAPARTTRAPLRTLRGLLAFTITGFVLLVCDVLQRTVVAGAARLFPRARSRILTFWIQAMRVVALDVGAGLLGGARLAPRLRIPSRPGVLVIMNHQSLLDIPLVVRSLEGNYPRIVTRSRYARGIPLISHMVRLYQYPVVDPQATVKGHLQGLQEASRNGESPLVIFPEGTRTRTGELGPWKRSGLRTMLRARQWEVWVVVADGVWHSRSVPEFMRDISRVRITMSADGPFTSPGPEGDVDAFIEHMHARMVTLLETLRRAPA